MKLSSFSKDWADSSFRTYSSEYRYNNNANRKPKMLKEVINYAADVANQMQRSYCICKKATFVVKIAIIGLSVMIIFT